jgi:hypothetical protein
LQKYQILDVALSSIIVLFPPVAQAGRHREIALAAVSLGRREMAHGGRGQDYRQW